jgi:hypothetical protein
MRAKTDKKVHYCTLAQPYYDTERRSRLWLYDRATISEAFFAYHYNSRVSLSYERVGKLILDSVMGDRTQTVKNDSLIVCPKHYSSTLSDFAFFL